MSGQIRVAIFDLDGVLVDSEQAWDAARKRLLRLEAKTLHVFLDRVEDLLRLTRQQWGEIRQREVKMGSWTRGSAVLERESRAPGREVAVAGSALTNPPFRIKYTETQIC